MSDPQRTLYFLVDNVKSVGHLRQNYVEKNQNETEKYARQTFRNKAKFNLLKLVGAYIRAIREAKIYEHELASELQALNLAHTHLSSYTPKPHRGGGEG